MIDGSHPGGDAEGDMTDSKRLFFVTLTVKVRLQFSCSCPQAPMLCVSGAITHYYEESLLPLFCYLLIARRIAISEARA